MIRALLLFLTLVAWGVFAGSATMHPPLECYLLTIVKKTDIDAPAGRYCSKSVDELAMYRQGLLSHDQKLLATIGRLESQFTQHMMQLSAKQRAQRADAIIQEPERLRALRLEHANTQAEIEDIAAAQRIQALNVRFYALVTSGLLSFFFVLSLILGRSRSGSCPRGLKKEVSVDDVERWLSEKKALSVMEFLDESKSIALERLWGLRPKQCNYCSATLPLTPTGRLEHVTILKEVPEDVRTPKRVVLGSGYQVIPPAQIVCDQCGHENRG